MCCFSVSVLSQDVQVAYCFHRFSILPGVSCTFYSTGSEKTIAILGYKWSLQTAAQEGDKIITFLF